MNTATTDAVLADVRAILDAIAAGEDVTADLASVALLDLTPLVPGLDRALETVYLGDGQDGPPPDAHRKALLAILDDWGQPPADTLAKLPKPTNKDNPKSRCNECGGYHGQPAVHLDYMGHADVTEALLKIDPFWNWRPAAINPNTGGPVWVDRNASAVMWAYLTVLGVERLCVGTAPKGKEELEKELIGDMLRNGALRFGIAVRLWSKADHVDAMDDTPAPFVAGSTAPPAQQHERPVADAAAETEGQAAAAEEGTAANRLAGIANTGALKSKAMKAGRDIAGEAGIDVPTSFDALLACSDEVLEAVIAKLAAAAAS